MKTLKEVLKSVKGNAALEEELKGLKSPGDAVAFFKKQGCETTEEELNALRSKYKEGELSDDEAAAVAGGESKDDRNIMEELWWFFNNFWPW